MNKVALNIVPSNQNHQQHQKGKTNNRNDPLSFFRNRPPDDRLDNVQ